MAYIKLKTICDIYDGTHKTPNYTTTGIKFVSVENITNLYATEKYISEEDYNKYKVKPQINDVLMTRIGTIGTCTVIEKNVPLAYYVSLALLRPNTKILNSKYLKYYIESQYGRKELYKRTLINAVPIKVNTGDIGKISIFVPPLEVQCEIVRILDNFTKYIALLEKELELRKKQYAYYRDMLLNFSDEVEWWTLGKIADINTGNSNTNEAEKNGIYPFFVRSQDMLFKNSYEYDETAIITAGDGVGVGKVIHYFEGKYALHQRAYRIHIHAPEIIPKFYFYYMKATFYDYISKKGFHSSVSSIRRPMLNEYPVPVPPLEEQKRIVEILDRFDRLCNDLTCGLPAEIDFRKRQYAYYRDKLLNFKGGF
ncbi:MAG: restriction endonuclease subunit S [Oscillospiraceae bacterium]|nr:restriction endonuclease subunit S [Oscillospiraceae bacterium]